MPFAPPVRRRLAALAATALLPALLAACAGGATADDAPPSTAAPAALPTEVPPGTTLVVGDPTTRVAVALAGEELGADDLVFDIEWANLSGGPQTTEAFRAGALDVGAVADIPPIHAQWTGLDVRIIAAVYREDWKENPIYEFGVAPGVDGVETLEDFAGHRVAYSPGQAQGVLVLRALQEAGLEPDDVELVELPSTGDVYATALAAGEIDIAPIASRIHPPGHEGEHFRVAGALTTPRSPQAYPLLVQAGSSEDGKDLAARYAEAVFTAQQTLDDALAFATGLKRRAVEWGRDPAGLLVRPGIVPVIGATEAEAREKEDELDRLIRPEYARAQLARTLRVEPEDLPFDRELPADLPSEDEIEGAKSRYTLVVELARRERLTVRQLIGRLGGGRGHRTFSGTAEQVADAIQEWWDAGAADGFNVMPPVLPSGLDDFVDQVVPVLVERGLFRREYTGTTLRDHYGLARPAHPRHRQGTGLGIGVVAAPSSSPTATEGAHA